MQSIPALVAVIGVVAAVMITDVPAVTAKAPTPAQLTCPTTASLGLGNNWTLRTQSSLAFPTGIGRPTTHERDITPAPPTGQPQEQCRYKVNVGYDLQNGSRLIDLYFNLRFIPAGASPQSFRPDERPGCGVSPTTTGSGNAFWSPSVLSYSAVHAAVSAGFTDAEYSSTLDRNEATKVMADHAGTIRRISTALIALGDSLAFTCNTRTPQPISIAPITGMQLSRGAGGLVATGGSSGTPISFDSAGPAAVCELGNQMPVRGSLPSRAHAAIILKGIGICRVSASQPAAPGFDPGRGTLTLPVVR